MTYKAALEAIGIGSIVSHFPLDSTSTTTDVIGGHDLTNVGSVTFGASGATFDGTNYLEGTDTDGYSIADTGELTVVAYINLSSWTESGRSNNGDTDRCYWLGKVETNSQNAEWGFTHYHDPDTSGENRARRISCYVWPSGGGLGAGSYYTASAWNTGEVHQVAITADNYSTSGAWNTDPNNPGLLTLFTDAVQRDADGNQGYAVDYGNTTTPLRIGGKVGSRTYFQGTIRRVTVFNRKLTLAELQSLYEARNDAEGTWGTVTKPIATLVDNFDNPTLSSEWTATGSVAVENNRLAVDAGAAAGTNKVESTNTWTLDESSILGELTFPDNSDSAAECYVRVWLIGSGSGNYVQTMLRNRATDPRAYWQVWAGGTEDSTVTTGATNDILDETEMKWFRISESAGVLEWETSPDGITWTSRRTMPTPAWVGTDNTIYVRVEAVKTSGSTAATGYVDNINVAPSVPPANMIVEDFESYTLATWPTGGAPSPEGGKWYCDNLGGAVEIKDTGTDQYAEFPGTLRSSNVADAVDITITADIERTSAPTTAGGAFQVWWGRVYSRGNDQYIFSTKQADGTDGWSLYKGSTLIKGDGTTTWGQSGTPQELKIEHTGDETTGTIVIYRDTVEVATLQGHPLQTGNIVLTSTEAVERVYEVLVDLENAEPPPPPEPEPPSAPTVTATAGTESIVATWTAAESTSTLTAYRVRLGDEAPFLVGAATLTYTFENLSPGITYTVGVSGVSAVGTGAEGTDDAVPLADTPTAGLPAVATSVSATAGSGSATVSWTASASGSPTAYHIYDSVGGKYLGSTDGAVSRTVTGLNDNEWVSFVVVAENAVGLSDPSSPSNAVLPLESGSSTSALWSRSTLGAYTTDAPTLESTIKQRLSPHAQRLVWGDIPTDLDGYVLLDLDATGITLASIADGTHDAYLDALSTALGGSSATAIFVNALWDANDWRNPWSPSYTEASPTWVATSTCNATTPDDVIIAYQRIARRLRSNPGACPVRMVWQAAVDPQPSPANDNWAAYHPGVFADVICLAGYNYGTSGALQGTSALSTWRDPDDIFDAPYAVAAALDDRAHIWLRTACHEPSKSYAPQGMGFIGDPLITIDSGNSKSSWVTSLMTSTSWPRVTTVIWHHKADTRNWLIDSTAAVVTVLLGYIEGDGTWDRTDIAQPATSAMAADRVEDWADWCRAGATRTGSYARPDVDPAGAVKAELTFGLPYSAGTKTLVTISTDDMLNWNKVHGVILRQMARHGLRGTARVSGERQLDDPLLLFPGSASTGRTILDSTRDTAPGPATQSAGGMIEPSGGTAV